MKPFSILRLNKTRALLLPAILGSALIAGCGGGGGSSGATSSTLSGTAASGAPIVGTVTAKDSTGTEKAVQIAADGSYSIDVSGMTEPFLLKANGTVGGRSVTLLSAATKDDINKTVNVTPLTDLIVANVTGKTADDSYNNMDKTKLLASDLDAAEAILQARLQPILDALLGTTDGATIDLLRAHFNANHTKLDAVLDMVQVKVDVNTKKATIKISIDPTKVIEDDLADKTDKLQIAAPGANVLSTVATNLQAIQTQLNTFSDQFATAIPATDNPALIALFDPTFKNGGRDRATFLSDLTTMPDMIGVKFSHVVIDEYITASKLKVKFVALSKNGKIHLIETFMVKDVTDKWLIAGDQGMIEVDVRALAEKSASGEIRTGLGLDVDGGNLDPTIDYVIAKGPGLPPAGIKMVRQSGKFVIEQSSGSFLTACTATVTAGCLDVAAVTDNATYTFELWDDKGTPTDTSDDTQTSTRTDVLPKAPYSSDYLTANATALFPSLTLPSLASFTAGTPSVSWSLPAGMKADELVVFWSGSSPDRIEADVASTAVTTTVKLPTFSSPPMNAGLTLHVEDLYDRKFSVSADIK